MPAAREAARALLAVCGVTRPDYLDRVELVVTEVVSNAVRHVGGCVWVDLSLDDGGLTVGATDSSERPPVIGGDGRGLLIVAALSAGWGSHDMPGGKRVWARIQQ